jgi:hypothetical protein
MKSAAATFAKKAGVSPTLCFSLRAMCKRGEERPRRSYSVRRPKCSVERVCAVARRETFGGEGTDEPSMETGEGTRWQCCSPARSLARSGSLVQFLLALSVALALTCPLRCRRMHLNITHGFQAAISPIHLLALLEPPAFAHLHGTTSGKHQVTGSVLFRMSLLRPHSKSISVLPTCYCSLLLLPPFVKYACSWLANALVRLTASRRQCVTCLSFLTSLVEWDSSTMNSQRRPQTRRATHCARHVNLYIIPTLKRSSSTLVSAPAVRRGNSRAGRRCHVRKPGATSLSDVW